jgi:hypothetical protein
MNEFDSFFALDYLLHKYINVFSENKMKRSQVQKLGIVFIRIFT